MENENQFYTPEEMLQFLDKLHKRHYQNWKWEQGIMEDTNKPWVSFESPDGAWMVCWQLTDQSTISFAEFDPNRKITLRDMPEKQG